MRASEFSGILPIANFGYKAVLQSARSVGVQQSAGAQASAVQHTSTQRPAQMQSQIQPQVQQQSTVKVGGTISLRDTLNKINSRVNTVPQEVQLGTSEFNAASVRTAIENFTDTKINDSQLQIVLKSLNPVVEGTKVIFSVDSNFTEQQIIPYKQRLESFIAASVNNRNLTIEINVVVDGAATSSKPVYITQADKLNNFIELNPVIAEMVELFGLEIE